MGLLELPADGPVAWTAHADLAAGAVAILLEPGRFEGPTPPLTAGSALDLREIAALVGCEHRLLEDDLWLERQVAAGVPRDRARFFLGFFEAARAGEFSQVDPLLEQLIGRPPATFAQVWADWVGSR